MAKLEGVQDTASRSEFTALTNRLHRVYVVASFLLITLLILGSAAFMQAVAPADRIQDVVTSKKFVLVKEDGTKLATLSGTASGTEFRIDSPDGSSGFLLIVNPQQGNIPGYTSANFWGARIGGPAVQGGSINIFGGGESSRVSVGSKFSSKSDPSAVVLRIDERDGPIVSICPKGEVSINCQKINR